MVLEKAYWR